MNPDSWNKLEAEAHWRLEHPDQSPPVELIRGMALQLRLWHYARSGAQLSWSIFLPARDYRTRRSVIRETAWDRPADWKRSRSAPKKPKNFPLQAPSVRIRDVKMDWAELSPFLDETGGLPMEALGKDPSLPAEQGRSGLEGFRSLAHIRLEWAGKGPRGWARVIAGVERFRNLLLRVMRERESEERNR